MEVIILAGGIGSRLQSVVSDVPKCMAPVDGKPFLHYLFQYLIPFKPSRVVLALGYKHEIVEAWVSTLQLPFEVVNSIESSPLGTGGAIKKAFSAVQGDYAIVINGDTFFEIALDGFALFHRMESSEWAEASLALKPMDNFTRYGSVVLNQKTHRITAFEEKKQCEYGLINGGIYGIQKHALDTCPEKFSIEDDFFAHKVAEGKLAGYVSYGDFIDIGVPEDYEMAQTFFNKPEDDKDPWHSIISRS